MFLFTIIYAVVFLITQCLFLPIANADENFSSSDFRKEQQTRSHVVQPSETLSEIAAMYGYPVSVVAEHNRIFDPNSVMAGQTIYMPSDFFSSKPFVANEVPSSYENDTDYGKNSVSQWDIAAEMNENEVRSQQISPEKHVDESAFGTKPYAYYGNDEPVAEVITHFASNYAMPVVISKNIKGMVNGKIGPLNPVAFLDKIAKIHNLIWYFDGNTLYVYDSNEIQKEIISLRFLGTDEFQTTLIEMGIWDNRFHWRSRPVEGLIYLSGPPRYMELVTQTAAIMDTKAGDKLKSQITVKVFPLKYAWADDRSFSFRDQQIVVPGIASTLSEIVKGGNFKLSTVPQKSLSGVKAARAVGQSSVPGNNQKSGADKTNDVNIENVFINADRRLNAVIIRDLESKMPMYASLINTLDKPLSQVEVNVSIIDIDTNSLERLGVKWKLSSGSGDFIEFNPFAGNESDSFSTIVDTTTGNLYSQINVLSSNGRAKVLARPSVLTLDNMEAVLDNSQTFYVEVAGQEDAQLFPVTYGSVLKVTPRIVEEPAGLKIHLSVNIHDGTRAASSHDVKDLPTIKNSSISTQAMIDENESLLVGGYYYERTQQGISKVPVLGDMPVIGALFRDKRDEYTKTVRLFLITPRIVNLM